MRSSSKRDIEVTLVLNEAEATWLMGNMQNPLHGQTDPLDEHPDDTDMRVALYTELASCLVV